MSDQGDPDVTSDPALENPDEDPQTRPAGDTSVDWTSEGGATPEGPATDEDADDAT